MNVLLALFLSYGLVLGAPGCSKTVLRKACTVGKVIR
jgi:hypothetical protein